MPPRISLGDDALIDYRVDDVALIDYRVDDVDAHLAELAPDGVDVFFDNVGDDILDSVLLQIHEGARVVICGAISQYGDMNNVTGPRNYLKLAERHASMEGFTVLLLTGGHRGKLLVDVSGND